MGNICQGEREEGVRRKRKRKEEKRRRGEIEKPASILGEKEYPNNSTTPKNTGNKKNSTQTQPHYVV